MVADFFKDSVKIYTLNESVSSTDGSITNTYTLATTTKGKLVEKTVREINQGSTQLSVEHLLYLKLTESINEKSRVEINSKTFGVDGIIKHNTGDLSFLVVRLVKS